MKRESGFGATLAHGPIKGMCANHLTLISSFMFEHYFPREPMCEMGDQRRGLPKLNFPLV